MTFFDKLFCKHSYELLQKYTLDSEYDIVVLSGKTPNTHCSLKRTYVHDYTCEHCGKLKRLTIKI